MNPNQSQRRLVAIMFTDKVGYSALLRRDEVLGLTMRNFSGSGWTCNSIRYVVPGVLQISCDVWGWTDSGSGDAHSDLERSVQIDGTLKSTQAPACFFAKKQKSVHPTPRRRHALRQGR